MNKTRSNLSQQRHSQLPLTLVGTLSVLIYILLCYTSHAYPPISIHQYLTLLLTQFFLYGLICLFLVRQNITPSNVSVFIYSLLFHIIGILAVPQFEDDYFRYLWDGYQFYEFANPYAHAPSFYFLNNDIPAHFQNLLNQINYPDVKTIYAPLLQYSFLVSHWFFPGDITGLQILYSACNLLIIIFLMRMTSPLLAMLYAWNPLIIKEIAFTAHPDIIGVLFLFMAIYYFTQRPKFAAICLGLSLCSKPFAWLIALFLIMRFKPIQWLLTIFTVGLLYAPFIVKGNEVSGLLAFAQDWQFNATIYGFLSSWFSPLVTKAICALLILALIGYCLKKYSKSPVRQVRGDLLIGGLLLLSPVINPWYLVWLLPFASLRQYISPWVASCVLMLSYLSGINLRADELAAYQLLPWVQPLEYTIIFMAILFDWVRHRKNKHK